jgi:hypothetical protein
MLVEVFDGTLVAEPDVGDVFDPVVPSEGFVVSLSDAKRTSGPAVEAPLPALPPPHADNAIVRHPTARPIL